MVVNDTNTTIGMATERNLLSYAIDAGAQWNAPTLEAWMTPKHDMLTVRLDDSIGKAASMLIHNGIFRHLPVLDNLDRLHSILDVRDVVLQVVGKDQGLAGWQGKAVSDVLGAKRRQRVEAAPGSSWPEQLEAYLLTHARKHTISSMASVKAAAKQMRDERLTFLVITEIGHEVIGARVVGLVNERSFLSFCAAHDSSRAPRTPDHSPVATVMTPLSDLVSCSITDTAESVVEKFFNNNMRHIPVIDRGQLVGIISVRDMLRPLLPPKLQAA
eukprot:CAMPEP_0174737396 /NCGR_PEP_ID=MMETSP1094-20130205/68264_1 /TAXON_ID=156173 /ORGANISM="Chrysochromulina brevifilum, Strain UTEX LB 985" /LENGTH=271 /DNA_ID=CAMNT_0015940621 /DNA_START=150 /DNA_END=965 /DNA_ORIENTATION=-